MSDDIRRKMAPVYENEGYYQKIIDLQDKLRKSEEERMKLEEKFNHMISVARDEEQRRLKKLRERYKRFLEESKLRNERNEKIIRNLDSIEKRATMLTAKTDRLRLLRKQYSWHVTQKLQESRTKPEETPIGVDPQTNLMFPPSKYSNIDQQPKIVHPYENSEYPNQQRISDNISNYDRNPPRNIPLVDMQPLRNPFTSRFEERRYIPEPKHPTDYENTMINQDPRLSRQYNDNMDSKHQRNFDPTNQNMYRNYMNDNEPQYRPNPNESRCFNKVPDKYSGIDRREHFNPEMDQRRYVEPSPMRNTDPNRGYGDLNRETYTRSDYEKSDPSKDIRRDYEDHKYPEQIYNDNRYRESQERYRNQTEKPIEHQNDINLKYTSDYLRDGRFKLPHTEDINKDRHVEYSDNKDLEKFTAESKQSPYAKTSENDLDNEPSIRRDNLLKSIKKIKNDEEDSAVDRYIRSVVNDDTPRIDQVDNDLVEDFQKRLKDDVNTKEKPEIKTLGSRTNSKADVFDHGQKNKQLEHDTKEDNILPLSQNEIISNNETIKEDVQENDENIVTKMSSDPILETSSNETTVNKSLKDEQIIKSDLIKQSSKTDIHTSEFDKQIEQNSTIESNTLRQATIEKDISNQNKIEAEQTYNQKTTPEKIDEIKTPSDLNIAQVDVAAENLQQVETLDIQPKSEQFEVQNDDQYINETENVPVQENISVEQPETVPESDAPEECVESKDDEYQEQKVDYNYDGEQQPQQQYDEYGQGYTEGQQETDEQYYNQQQDVQPAEGQDYYEGQQESTGEQKAGEYYEGNDQQNYPEGQGYAQDEEQVQENYNEYYGQEGEQNYGQDGFVQGEDGQYAQQADGQYVQEDNQQYEQQQDGQYVQEDNQQYEQQQDGQYVQEDNQQYEQQQDGQYVQEENQQYEQQQDGQYVEQGDVQYDQQGDYYQEGQYADGAQVEYAQDQQAEGQYEDQQYTQEEQSGYDQGYPIEGQEGYANPQQLQSEQIQPDQLSDNSMIPAEQQENVGNINQNDIMKEQLPNLANMLDSDTDSMQQPSDQQKVSESDFDFSVSEQA